MYRCDFPTTTLALFSDSDLGDGKLALLTFLSMCVGSVGQYVIGMLLGLRRERREKQERDEANIVAHQKALIDRIDAEKKALEDEKRGAEREREECEREKVKFQIRRGVMIRHIRYLESVLRRVGNISYDPFVEEDETGTHTPLPVLNPNTVPNLNPNAETKREGGN